MPTLRTALSVAIGLQGSLLVPLDQPRAKAPDSGYAVVTQGAFLLSKNPEIPLQNPRFHSLEGYLPIGTVVWVDQDKKKIYNRDKDRLEDYFFIRSELGYDGLIRKDLLVRFGDKPMAVPVGPRKVELYRKPYSETDKPDDCEQDDRCIHFSRNDDVHLEIIEGKQENDYYKVMLYRHRHVRDYPMQEEGWISKNRVKYGSVKIVDTTVGPGWMASWSNVAPPESSLEDIIAKFKEQVTDTSTVRCLLSLTGQLNLGVQIPIPFVDIGTGITIDTQLKEKDKFSVAETYALKEDDKDETYKVWRNINCDNSQPARMQQLTLQKESGSDGDRSAPARILLQDIDDGSSQWIRSLKGEEAPTKMVALDSWESYNAIYGKLQDWVNEGGGYLSDLDTLDQQILLNFIVQQISYFTHRNRKDFAAEQ
jgi:hypothetical protein